MIVSKETLPDMRWRHEGKHDLCPMKEYLVLLNFAYDSTKVKVLRTWPGAVWHVERKVWMLPVSKEAIDLLTSWKGGKHAS